MQTGLTLKTAGKLILLFLELLNFPLSVWKVRISQHVNRRERKVRLMTVNNKYKQTNGLCLVMFQLIHLQPLSPPGNRGEIQTHVSFHFPLHQQLSKWLNVFLIIYFDI